MAHWQRIIQTLAQGSVIALLPCQCVKCALLHSVTHHHITDILIYTIIYNTYTILCHAIHTIYTIPAHTVIYDTVQHIYTHTLIYSDTPSHDLLLLHKDIHIIPVYASPSAMPYIIIYHTYNKIQKQDRQQQTYGRRT